MNEDNNQYMIPYSNDYNPLKVSCYGFNIYNELRVWTLSVDNGKLILSNDMGVKYELCVFQEKPTRISFAFLSFQTPYIVIQYEDGTSAFYSYDLNKKDFEFIREVKDHRDITMIYDRRTSPDKIVTYSVLGTSIYSGLLDVNTWDTLTQAASYPDALMVNIQRIGQTLTRQVKVEISTVKAEHN